MIYFDMDESHHFIFRTFHKSTHINAAVHLPTTQFVSKRQKLLDVHIENNLL